MLTFQEDVELIGRMIASGEATYDKWRHPDPYIGMWSERSFIFVVDPVEVWNLQMYNDEHRRSTLK